MRKHTKMDKDILVEVQVAGLRRQYEKREEGLLKSFLTNAKAEFDRQVEYFASKAVQSDTFWRGNAEID